MDAGIPIELFWESSVNEILDMMESYSRKEKRKRKQKILDDFIIAEVAAANIAALFDKKAITPKPWDYYLGIFDEDKKSFEERKRLRDLEDYKKQRQEYIKEFNRRRQQGT